MSARMGLDLISLTIAPRSKHVVMNVHYTSLGTSVTVTMTGDEAAELAAWLLMMGGLTGSTETQISKLAIRLREKFDDLAHAITILTPDEHRELVDACPLCGRVIHNKGNRERHLRSCMEHPMSDRASRGPE